VASQSCWAEPAISLVRVIKSEHKLQLFSGATLVHEFHVVFGANPKGHKVQEGDERTPEGTYVLDYKKSDSAFYRAIHVSYPNTKDIARSQAQGLKPGGQIMIHGQKNGWGWLSFISQRFNWTNGCIALTNHDMDLVWKFVHEGTPIELLP
jgi:murein L,D-transpeptidase YafK